MIKSLAEYVVNGGDSASAVLNILICLFALLSILVGSFLKSYVTEKGKNYASKEDVDKIINQLKITTETTEQIKSSIQHGAWRKKEVEALKRNKLEEYVRLVMSLTTMVNKEVSHLLDDKESDYDTNLYVLVEGVRILYLPELLGVSIGLSKSMGNYKKWLSEGVRIKASKENASTNGLLLNEHIDGYKNVLDDIGMNISNVIKEIYIIAGKLNAYEN